MEEPGGTRVKIRIQLQFPLTMVTEPVVYHLVKDYDLIPNIRKANIDPKTGGYVFMDLEGLQDNLFKALEYLRNSGVVVNALGVDGAQEWVIR